MNALMWIMKEVMQSYMTQRPTRVYSGVTCTIACLLVILSIFLGIAFLYQWLSRIWEPWIGLGILSAGTFLVGVILLLIAQRGRTQAHPVSPAISAPLEMVKNNLTAQLPQLGEMLFHKRRWEMLALMLLAGFLYARRDKDKRDLA